MKVKELIDILSSLDQDREIWVHEYMSFSRIPEVEVVDENTSDLNRQIKAGDYIL